MMTLLEITCADAGVAIIGIRIAKRRRMTLPYPSPPEPCLRARQHRCASSFQLPKRENQQGRGATSLLDSFSTLNVETLAVPCSNAQPRDRFARSCRPVKPATIKACSDLPVNTFRYPAWMVRSRAGPVKARPWLAPFVARRASGCLSSSFQKRAGRGRAGKSVATGRRHTAISQLQVLAKWPCRRADEEEKRAAGH